MTTTIEWPARQMREALCVMVRRRVPERDAEDVVQSVLTEAIASPHRPEEPESARRWIWGMARNKIADYHRHARRETITEVEPPVAPSGEAVRDLLDWAATELPPCLDDARTFEWLLRESEGEKLEEIARREKLPATQVRQRVSRLRRHFRARWAVYAAMLGMTTLVAMWIWRRERASDPDPLAPTMQVVPDRLAATERARILRAEAQLLCARSQWSACLERINGARALDPVGDDAIDMRALREAATRGRGREEPNGQRAPGMPSTTGGPRDALLNRQRARDPAANRGIFATLGAPGGGMAGGASGIVSPFGALTGSGMGNQDPSEDMAGDSFGDAFGYGGLGATGSGWGGTGEGSVGPAPRRHSRRRVPASSASGAPPADDQGSSAAPVAARGTRAIGDGGVP